ncbi:hypothetical protein vBYenSP400_78 [Yersinia phage vB_YenS_P400]|nr:hypothetical protein vBYenSP400_78 [Yersinia phage vB_YenS_P400]
MIKHIQQQDMFKYKVIRESENDSGSPVNMITGQLLMEVYYHVVPVFRCNMGYCKDDDVLVSRIKHGDNIAYIMQPWESAKKVAFHWEAPEVFASHALMNFCKEFGLNHSDVYEEMKTKRREKDSISTIKGITE